MADPIPAGGDFSRVARQDRGNRRVQQEKPAVWKNVRIDALRSRGGTGVELNALGQQTGEYDNSKAERPLSEGLKKQYTHKLTTHLNKLIEISTSRDANVRRVLNNPAHSVEKDLLNLLTDEVDLPGGKRERKINTEKIQLFLDKEDGLLLATSLMEQQLAMQLFALGLHASLNPEGRRTDIIDPQRIHTKIDQAVINRAFNGIRRWWNEPYPESTTGRGNTQGMAGLLGRVWGGRFTRGSLVMSTIGGIELGAGTGAVVAGLPGAIVGAAAVPTLELLQHFTRAGITLDLQQCSAAFRVISQNPQEAEYMRIVAGINVGDFVDTGNNRIVARNDGAILLSGDLNERKAEVLEQIYTRNQFYRSIGVEANILDALPEQFIYQYYTGQSEEIGTTALNRTNDLFAANRGGIRDGAGNRIELLVGGTWVRNPAFNPDLNGMDFQGNLERYMQARRLAMAEKMKDIFERHGRDFKQLTLNSTEVSLNTIAAKIANRPEQLTERRRVDAEEKTRLDTDVTSITAERNQIEAYRTSITEIRTARNGLTNMIRSRLGPGLSPQDARERLERVINDPAFNLTVLVNGAPRIINSIAFREAALGPLENARSTAERAGLGPNPTEADFRRVEGIVEAAFRNDHAQINNDRAIIDEILTAIETQQRSIQSIQDTLIENSPTVRDIAEEMSTLERELTEISALHGHATAVNIANTLDPVSLRTQPLEVLLTRINSAQAIAPGFPTPEGWPVADNTRADIRMRVLHAKLEADALYRESIDPNFATYRPAMTLITNPASWNLSENYLRAHSEAEVVAELTNRSVALGIGVPGINLIRNAMAWADTRLLIRSNVMNEMITQRTELARLRQVAIDSMNADQETETLTMAQNLMNRQGDILALSYEIAADPRRIFDRNLIVPGQPGFTITESAAFGGAQLPRGYIEVMNSLFDYREKGDNEQQFQRILRIMPPDRFADIVNTSLNLGLVPGGTLNIDNVFRLMQTRLSNRRFTSLEVRQAFLAVMDRVRAETITIT